MPSINISDKTILSSIRRMRLGAHHVGLFMPQANEVLNLALDEDIDLEEKDKLWKNLLLMYEKLSENHLFKNSYFVCIVNVLVILFFRDKTAFRFLIRILLKVLKKGKISLETYYEILAHLIASGSSRIILRLFKEDPKSLNFALY